MVETDTEQKLPYAICAHIPVPLYAFDLLSSVRGDSDVLPCDGVLHGVANHIYFICLLVLPCDCTDVDSILTDLPHCSRCFCVTFTQQQLTTLSLVPA